MMAIFGGEAAAWTLGESKFMAHNEISLQQQQTVIANQINCVKLLFLMPEEVK